MPRAARFLPIPCALLFLVACQSDKPEAQAKKALSQAIAAVEAGDVRGVLEVLHPDFQGSYEGQSLDRAQARFVLMVLFRQGKVGLTLLGTDARLEGAEVVQAVDLLISQGGDRGRRHYLLTWARKGGTYKLRHLQEVQ